MAHLGGENERGQEVYYCYGRLSIPVRLLYTSGAFAFVQFETRDWEGYQGFSNFVTAAIYLKHLRPAEQSRPLAGGLSLA
jgi:hypothetical protein